MLGDEEEMKKNGWIRLMVVLSLAWLIGVSGIAIYEKFIWEPTGHDLDGNQLFYYYYSDPTQHQGFIPLIKNFDEIKYLGALFWPLIVLWVVYGFLYYGSRWIRAGFKGKST